MVKNAQLTTLGFSLFELLVVLGIVSILALLALPSYRHIQQRVHCRQATLQLSAVAAQLQDYYTQHDSFVGATLYGLHSAYYRILAILHVNSYCLELVPFGAQLGADCRPLRVSGGHQQEAYWN